MAINTKAVFLVFGSWIFFSVYFLKIYTDLYEVLQKTRRETKRGVPADQVTRENNFQEAAFVREMYLPRNFIYQDSIYYDETPESISDERNPKYAVVFEGGKGSLSNISRVDLVVFSSESSIYTHHVKYVTECENGYVVTEYADYNFDEVTSRFDVVAFAGEIKNDRIWDYLVEHRDSHQLWLLHTDFNPLASMYFLPPREMTKAVINLSFTYHSKADISTPYGYFVLSKNASSSKRSTSLIGKHKKFAAWDSGFCSLASWDRIKFVTDLSKFISIDVYGDCGNLSCGSTRAIPRSKMGAERCNHILREYKFVMTLEESCCSEYITDHFWNALVHCRNIPIVVGASKEDYEKLAPPNSFIFAGDFNTISELAVYLLKVASSPDLYNSFFDWRKQGEVKVTTYNQRQMKDEKAMCKVYDYVKSANNGTMKTTMDPYGPYWLGGCTRCHEYKIINGS